MCRLPQSGLQSYFQAAARRKGATLNDLVNDLLSREIGIVVFRRQWERRSGHRLKVPDLQRPWRVGRNIAQLAFLLLPPRLLPFQLSSCRRHLGIGIIHQRGRLGSGIRVAVLPHAFQVKLNAIPA